jgi:hypothetical protein
MNFPVRWEYDLCVGSTISMMLAKPSDAVGSCSGLVLLMPSISSVVVFFCFAFVECKFFLCWSKCPMVVATDFGRYLCTSLAVNISHVWKWLFLIGLIHVCVVGLNKLACRCCMAAILHVAVKVALACCGAGIVVLQSPGRTQLPSRTSVLFCVCSVCLTADNVLWFLSRKWLCDVGWVGINQWCNDELYCLDCCFH